MEIKAFKAKEGLNILGEYGVCFFILSIFLNGKLNLKIGYFIQGIFLLKLIFDRKNIFIKEKRIYITFMCILLLGIIMNFISSKGNGWEKFFSQNIKFIFGLIFIVFIDSFEKLKKALIFLLLGVTIISFSEVSNLNFIKISYTRTRPLIMMGAVFFTIYLCEKIKNNLNIKKIQGWIYLIIPATLGTLGIMYSDSRMGFLVYIIILGIYVFYNLVLYKIDVKKISLLVLILFGFSLVIYTSMPLQFREKIKTSFETKNNFSNEARLVMWNGGIKAFKSKPLTGVGSLSKDTQPYNIESAKEYKNTYIEDSFVRQKHFTEHHSIYINFLSQNGLVLTLLYLYLFFIQIPMVFLKNRKDSLAMASYATILSFLIYGVTWSVWTVYSSSQILFHIFLGILICQSKRGDKEKKC